MSSVQLQFHATRADLPEICQVIRSAADGVRIYTWGQPYHMEEVGLANVVPDLVTQIVASVGEMEVPKGNPLELFDRYPGLLVMNLPITRDDQLLESDLSARANVPAGDAQVAIWRKMIRKLRGQLISGADVLNPRTGESRFYRDAHATSRAVEAARSGIRLTAPGGNVFLFHAATDKGP